MRIYLILNLSIAFFITQVAFGGDLDPKLEEHLATMNDDDLIPVVIFLKVQADIDALDQKLTAMLATRQHRHEVVVRELQTVAEFSQKELANILDIALARGWVENVKSYWIVNAFSAIMTKELVLKIVGRKDIEIIYFYAPIELIKPMKNVPLRHEIQNREVNLGAIRATECWAMGINGAGTIVANLDTGVDGRHPALASRWQGNFAPAEHCFYDAVNIDNHIPFDSGEHGTLTMGTMMGLDEANRDTIGVAWAANWIAAACVDRDSSGHPGYLDSFEFMADPDRNPETVDDVPDVLNNSWGTLQYQPCDTLFWEVIDNCEAAGVIVVFAVGNEGSGTLRRPADRATTAYNSYTVGATEKTAPYSIATFSGRGPTYCADGPLSIKPEVSAPGVGIRSSIPGGSYASRDGTSMAAPHVAGVLALMRQVNPNIEPNVAKQILMNTAIDLGDPGEDNSYGWGFIDAYAAVMETYATISSFEGIVVDGDTQTPLSEALVSTAEDSLRMAITDADGFYHLSQLPGTYHLRVQRFGYNNYQSEMSYTIAANDTFFVDIEIASTPSAELNGYVVDINDDPIAGVVLTPLVVPVEPVTTDEIGYYLFESIPGDHTYAIEAYFGDFDPQIQEVTVPAGGSTTLDFILRVAESFEDANNGFYPVGTPNDWEWGRPEESGGPAQAYQGSNVWGTNLDGVYRPLADYALHSPEYFLIPGENLHRLKFYQWYQIEEGWDGGNVSISADHGENWTLIHPEEEYPNQSLDVLEGQPGYTGHSGDGNSPEWVIATFDLSEYEGQEVSFSFNFSSTNNTNLGWFLDNVIVYGSVEYMNIEQPLNSVQTPLRFDLFQNYPNPFNPKTEIRYSLPIISRVQLEVYSIDGKCVSQLVDAEQTAGFYTITWNGTDNKNHPLPSGIYFYRLKSDAFEAVQKMVLLK